MAKCPACDHNVRTPLFLNLEAWSHLTCAQCNARLEMRPPRSALFAPLMVSLFVAARQSRLFAVAAFALMFGLLLTLSVEILFPRVQLRKKPLPKPEVWLKIDGQSN